MIKTSHAELDILRRGAIRRLRVKGRTPAQGARKAKPPLMAGRVYQAYAPTRYKNHVLERARATLEVMVLDVREDGDEWVATVRKGYGEDVGVYLTSRPGTQRADYTTDPARALHDEPEVMGETVNDIVARLRAAETYSKRSDKRPWVR